MSWSWIAFALTVPTVVALLVAWPLWRRGNVIVGNVLGAGIILMAVILLIANEWVVVERLILECRKKGELCTAFSIRPTAFVRYAIWGSIGFLDIFALFIVSLAVEERVRRRAFARNWQ